MYLTSTFIIAAATYLLLLLADAIRPGFVSSQFSPHWLLLFLLILCSLLAMRGQMFPSSPRVERVLVIVASLIAAAVTWSFGRSLGDEWLLLVLLSAAVPPLVYFLFRSDV